MASADRILLVVDSDEGLDGDVDHHSPPDQPAPSLPANIPVTVVRNKIDLSGDQARLDDTGPMPVVYLSAVTGAGIDLLQQHLKHCMGYREDSEGGFSARRRHLEALEQAMQFLVEGQQQLQHAGAAELLAEDLRQCHNRLGEITGKVSSDELLGKIFSSFCIGK